MKYWAAPFLGLSVSIALSSASLARHPSAPAVGSCCAVPAGTVVDVALAEPVSTKVQRAGDRFALRLAQPLVIDGHIVMRAGTPGVGVVVQSSKPGMGGKGAKLVLAARYLDDHGRHVSIVGLRLARAGHDNTTAADAVGLSGFAFAPLGFLGLAVVGGNVKLPAGTEAIAKIATNEVMRPLGRAGPAIADAAPPADDAAAAPIRLGSISLAPPPSGHGQVVFFRPKSLLGVGQWFKVRERKRALGKLSNGAYFVQIADPGLHTYTARTEPESNDHLTLEVDPGETYFVVGTLTKGLVIGVADIAPSDANAFARASKALKPAAAHPAHDVGDADVGPDVDNAASNSVASAPGRGTYPAVDSAP
jgi:hypothetical protein